MRAQLPETNIMRIEAMQLNQGFREYYSLCLFVVELNQVHIASRSVNRGF